MNETMPAANVPEALEFALLRRACADGTPIDALCGGIDNLTEVLGALVSAGRLAWREDRLVLTAAGEDRLDWLFVRMQAPQEGDLTSRLLRLLGTVGPLDIKQIAAALGAREGTVHRCAQLLTDDGLLSRAPKPNHGQRGRARFMYGHAA